MKLRIFAAACLVALAVQLHPASSAIAADAAVATDAPAGEHWVSAWGTSLQSIPQLANLPPLYRAPEVGGRTVRQLIYPQLDRKPIPLRLSNPYRTNPLLVEAMHVARAAGSGRRLLHGLPPLRLETIRGTTSPSGHLLVTYRVLR